MENSTFRNALRWIGWIACAAWLVFSINRQVLQLDPSQFGFRAPNVEAEMKNCTSDDARLRYECKEQAILTNQRVLFVQEAGRWMLVFGPPIALWLVARRLLRPRDGEYLSRLPPPIKKWRVK